MRRTWAAVAAGVIGLVFCAGVRAEQTGEPVDDIVGANRLHRPQDVAPPEQTIVPRPVSEGRPKGSLIQGAHHSPRRVDAEELRERKLRMYAGQIVTQPLPGPAGPVSPMGACEPTALETDAGRSLAAVTWWSLVAVCAVAALWLLTKVALSYLCEKHPRNREHLLTPENARWCFHDAVQHVEARNDRLRHLPR